MKLSVSTYSFGAYMHQDRLGVHGVIDSAADMGFAGIEFVEGEWTEACSLDDAAEIREHCARRGLTVVSYCVGADFALGSGGDETQEIARVCRSVDFAAALGAQAMRHDVGQAPPAKAYGNSFDDLLPVYVRGCRAVADYAQTLGVKTMTENHGWFVQDAQRLEKLVNAVAHPNFGLLVDVGNFLCVDEDPNCAVGLLARYAQHVHVKDFHRKQGTEPHPGAGWFVTRGGNYLRGAIIGHGDARVAQSIRNLRIAGYDGYLSIEFEGLEDNLVGIRLGLENLKSYIG